MYGRTDEELRQISIVQRKKANHNHQDVDYFIGRVAANINSSKKESKSQPVTLYRFAVYSCGKYQ